MTFSHRADHMAMHRTASIVLSFLVVATSFAAPASAADDPSQADSRQLEFRRTSHKPVLAVGAPGAFDAHWVTCPTIVADEEEYHLWYSSLYDANLGPGGIGYAKSNDGIDWQRQNNSEPVLTVGTKDAGDDGQVMGPEVLRVGDEFYMWYTGMPHERHASGIGYYRIFLARSTDGLHWNRANKGRPVLDLGSPGSPDDVQAATPSIIRVDGEFRMWYAAWSPHTNHTICAARSEDGVIWYRENEGRHVTGLNPSVAFGHAVCRWQGRLLMTYMALQARRGMYGAVSDDGLHWTMLNDGEPVLSPGPKNNFDAAHVGHAFLLPLDRSLRMWYTGYQSAKDSPNLGLRLQIGVANAITISP